MPETLKGPTSELKGPISEEKEEPIIEQRESGKVLADEDFTKPFLAEEAPVPGRERYTIPVSVRLTPSLKNLIDELILHPRLPYSNESDFLRDAVYKFARGLVYHLKTRGFDVGKMMPFLSKLEALQLEVERHLALKRITDMVSGINETVSIYIQEEAWVDLLNLLEDYARMLNGMPSGFYSKLAIGKFFMQSNVAEALRALRVKKVDFSPNLLLAGSKFTVLGG